MYNKPSWAQRPFPHYADEIMTSQEMEEQWLQSLEPSMAERMEQMMQRMQELEGEVRRLQERLDHHVGWHSEIIEGSASSDV